MRLLVILIIMIPGMAHALGVGYADTFCKNIQTIIDAHPRYVWGGSVSEAKGLDCSGYIYLGAKRSGFPVFRTTARNMRLGLGGWIGYDLSVFDSEALDLVWWTFTATRPDGHIGILWRDRDGMPTVTHASGSAKGVVVGFLQGSLFRDISGIRRLRFGESSAVKQEK